MSLRPEAGNNVEAGNDNDVAWSCIRQVKAHQVGPPGTILSCHAGRADVDIEVVSFELGSPRLEDAAGVYAAVFQKD